MRPSMPWPAGDPDYAPPEQHAVRDAGAPRAPRGRAGQQEGAPATAFR